MGAVLADYRTAPIPEPERALFAFLEKVNRNSWEITEANVEAARQAGWSDQALYDAINVCALFNFYNRWVDATGVRPLSEQGYRASGKRLARRGYAIMETG